MNHKFLISYNPLEDSSRTFITHTEDPVIIAEAFHFSECQEEEWMELKRRTSVGSSVYYPGELIVLSAIYVAPINVSQESADGLAKVMREMGDWYYKYLELEDLG